jgi:hypothetical protein
VLLNEGVADDYSHPLSSMVEPAHMRKRGSSYSAPAFSSSILYTQEAAHSIRQRGDAKHLVATGPAGMEIGEISWITTRTVVPAEVLASVLCVGLRASCAWKGTSGVLQGQRKVS